MRVTVIAVGGRGDVQPMAALASGLRSAGHAVRFATEAGHGPLVAGAGLDLVRLSGDSEAFNAGRGGAVFRDSVRKPATRYRRFWRAYVAPAARLHLREAVAPCAGADLLVCQPWFGIGPSLGEHFGCPAIVAGLFPVPQLPTSAFRFPLRAQSGQAGTPEENCRSWRSAVPVVRAGHTVIQEWRSGVLGLSEQSFGESLLAMRRCPHLLGYSPSVLPKPDDWGEDVEVTGYWFGEPAGDYEPPAALRDFLADGEAPVVVGFGSHVGRNPLRLTQVVLEALRLARRRAVLITGWGGLAQTELPPGVLVRREVPYDWLLPRAAALVHHGGAGTTGMALRYGIPQVITPFGWDQSFWGWRCADLGVAPEPVEARAVTARQLADAIEAVVADPPTRQRAWAIAHEVRAERGIQAAVAAIERIAARRANTTTPTQPANAAR